VTVAGRRSSGASGDASLDSTAGSGRLACSFLGTMAIAAAAIAASANAINPT
jgi:hypothetical protein